MKFANRPTARTAAALTVFALSATALAACSSSSKSASPAAPAPASGSASGSSVPEAYKLAGVCPATVVIQQDWEPEAEHSGSYQLIGTPYKIDKNKKRVSGPLTIGGYNTGVQIEVRAGGAGIGYAGPDTQMYIDKSITLSAVSTDGSIGDSGTSHPTLAVVAQLNKSPQMLMWDPASHPNYTSIADAGKDGATFSISKGASYAKLLEQKGIIKASQLDQGYTGAPARFIASPKIVQQGFATAEPYIYEHEIKQWSKPVKFQLLSDAGINFNLYPEPLAIRTGELGTLSPCLKKLVPILQQAQVNYFKDPGPTNTLINAAVTAYNDGWTYSMGVANYAATTMKSLGIVANDSSGPLGGMDTSRIQSSIDTFAPLLSTDGLKVKPGLTPADIATTQFIDPSIKLGS